MGLGGFEPPTVRVKAACATVAPQAQSGAVCVFLVCASSSSLVDAIWWAEQDSNLRQLVCRTSVLAAELPAREPLTLCRADDRIRTCTWHFTGVLRCRYATSASEAHSGSRTLIWTLRMSRTAVVLSGPTHEWRTAQDSNLTPRESALSSKQAVEPVHAHRPLYGGRGETRTREGLRPFLDSCEAL